MAKVKIKTHSLWVIVVVIILSEAIAFLCIAGIVKLASLCFDFDFQWKYAALIYAAAIVLKMILPRGKE
jgi:Na+/H+-dicarboxylate symporter